MTKISARLVPRLLIPDRKRILLITSQGKLALFEADPACFCESSWMLGSSSWARGMETTKISGMQKTLYLLTILKRVTPSRGHISNMLRLLRNALQIKITRKLAKIVFCHHWNEGHKSFFSIAAMRKCDFKLIDNRQYFHGLSSYDYHLFLT